MGIIKSTIDVAHYNMESDISGSSRSDVKWGGSHPGRSPNINRDFEGAYNMLASYYFSGEESLYNEATFERRFCSPRCVVLHNFDAVDREELCVQKENQAMGKLGIGPLVQFAVVRRILKYDNCSDLIYEHCSY